MCDGQVLDEYVAGHCIQTMGDQLVLASEGGHLGILTEDHDIVTKDHQVPCGPGLCVVVDHGCEPHASAGCSTQHFCSQKKQSLQLGIISQPVMEGSMIPDDLSLVSQHKV